MFSSSFDSSTCRVSWAAGSMLPCDIVHLSETASETSSPSKSSHINDEASVGGMIEDIRLSVNSAKGVVKPRPLTYSPIWV